MAPWLKFTTLEAPPAIDKAPKKPKIDPCAVPRDLTVMTFNIKGGRVSPGELGGIAGVIRASGADVVLLQEVDQNRRRSGNVDQPAIIASHLGMQSVFGANDYITDRGGYGNAILSRFPIAESGNTHDQESDPGNGLIRPGPIGEGHGRKQDDRGGAGIELLRGSRIDARELARENGKEREEESAAQA